MLKITKKVNNFLLKVLRKIKKEYHRNKKQKKKKENKIE